jgi:PKHD-type hydroxylase
MFLILKSMLNPEEIARLRVIAQEMKFVDGRMTTTGHPGKLNLQAPRDPADAHYQESAQIVSGAYGRNRQFLNFAFPKMMSHPLLSRYDVGMKYGSHCDSAFMPVPPNVILRSDLSTTTFISDPDSYQGGELVIHLGGQPVPIKLPAGDAVIYPSTTIHEVAEVTSGSRLVSVSFIESLIRETHLRNHVYELSEVAEAEKDHMSLENRVRLEATIQNLKRMWGTA